MGLPRLLLCCLAALPFAGQHPLAGNDHYNRKDAFEYTHLDSIFVSSIWYDPGTGRTFDKRDLFGGTFGTQEPRDNQQGSPSNGHFVFADPPPGPVDWVEFRTREAVPLEAVRIAVARDLLGFGRATTRVVFKADPYENGSWVTLLDYVPEYSATNGVLRLSTVSDQPKRLASRVVSRVFLVEFYRDPLRPDAQRILEIDAYTTPNPEPPKVRIKNLKPDMAFLSSETVPIQVAASDPQGIDRVEIYVNDGFFESRSAPFDFAWPLPYAGYHRIRAKAVDKLGREASHEVQIEVLDELPPLSMSPSRIAGGHIHFDISGESAGRAHVVVSSIDQMNWTPVKTNRFVNGLWTFSEPLGSGPPRYYDVRTLPNFPSPSP